MLYFICSLVGIIIISIIIFIIYKTKNNKKHLDLCKNICENFLNRKIVDSDEETLFNHNEPYDFYLKLGKNEDTRLHYYFKVLDNYSEKEIIIKNRFDIYLKTKKNIFKKATGLNDFIRFIPKVNNFVKVVIVNPDSSAILELNKYGSYNIIDYFDRIYEIHFIPYEKIINNYQLLEEIR